MFLVVGGLSAINTYYIYISSTELLHRNSSAWVTVNNLPRTMKAMGGATLDGFLYMTG